MNEYPVDICLTHGNRVVETICADSKITAHIKANQKYGALYAASAILQETMGGASARKCPRCGNTEHLPGAKFCMICGLMLEPTRSELGGLKP